MSIRARQIPIPLLLMAAAAALAAYVIANATATSSPRVSGEPVAKAAAQVLAGESAPAAKLATAESAQLAAFSVLGDPSEPMPSALAESVSEGRMAAGYGLNVSLARPVGNTGVWLIPGQGELCLWELNSKGVGGGGTCATTTAASEGELAISRMSESGVQHGVGVDPDGTTSVSLAGSGPVAVHNNGWEATTGAGTSVATLSTQDGTSTVEVP